ncbi:PIN domain-containing protein [Shinella zoogloeoides]|uniref:Uncharacterized protein n=1 Tax=Shinella zoogloeoides TaxID=352475 RepID=A0A6N8TK88_SHIZO|nr:hypothetical protein [Shinella zoogloeoides]MXO02835.1 hypothetical protein [Shinella zoogloeoides]UEX84518.1 hypothetical protein K8M09_23550 [Shinella zoogloeoides]
MSKGTILERVQEMTRQAQEREAEKLMTLELVKEAISEAARQGYSRAVIVPAKALDLTKTEMAKATVAQLRKEGFRTEWEVRLQADNTSYQALVVSW